MHAHGQMSWRWGKGVLTKCTCCKECRYVARMAVHVHVPQLPLPKLIQRCIISSDYEQAYTAFAAGVQEESVLMWQQANRNVRLGLEPVRSLGGSVSLLDYFKSVSRNQDRALAMHERACKAQGVSLDTAPTRNAFCRAQTAKRCCHILRDVNQPVDEAWCQSTAWGNFQVPGRAGHVAGNAVCKGTDS